MYHDRWLSPLNCNKLMGSGPAQIIHLSMLTHDLVGLGRVLASMLELPQV